MDIDIVPAHRVERALKRSPWSGQRPEGGPEADLVSAIPHPERLVFRDFGVQAAGKLSPRRLQDAFDISFYHLILDLDSDRSPELDGQVRVVGRALVALDTLALDLARTMEVIDVTSATGRAVAWHHGLEPKADQLVIVPEGGLQAGQVFEMAIAYRGDPVWDAARGGYASGRRSAGDPYIWTLSEPYGAMEWWPTENHPADKADSVRVTLTVPSSMTAASNGLLISETDRGDGRTTFDWQHGYPIATYLVSIAAGEYDRVVDSYIRPPDLVSEFGPATFPIEQYAYRDIPAVEGINAVSGWRLTKEAMAIQEDWFGPYPFADEKYGNAHVTFRGGMEHQTLSSMGNIGIELIAHELAHQWYGDALSPASWRDLWLNEGFATLGEMLTFEADLTFDPVREILFDIYYDRAREAQGTLVLSDTTNAQDMFTHARVYAKGWMVLRMIRSRVGDTVFKQILRTWAASPEVLHGTVVTEQFERVVEEITDQDWSVFFNQWVYDGTGEPTWQLAWEENPEDAPGMVRVAMNQVQDRLQSNVEAFQVLIPVWFETTDVTYQVWLDVDEREEVFDVAIPAPVLAVYVDPERWLLRGEAHSGTGTRASSLPEHALVVEVAPHPAQGTMNITILPHHSGQGGHETTIEVFDLTGRRVWKAIRSAGSPLTVRIPGLASGRYLLRVRQGSHIDEQLVVVRAS